MGRKKTKNIELELELETLYRFNENTMKYMGIEPLKPEELYEGHEELWKYAVFDRHKELTNAKLYFVSNYGRFYNIAKRRLEKHQESDCFKSSVARYWYYRVTNYNTGEQSAYFAHRIVALSFLEPDEDRPFVNHIDGNPSHNYLWNLEWCNASENFHHAERMGLINQPKGEERPNALWTDNEIHMICKMMEDGHKATYIYHVLGDILHDPKVEYERVRTLYKHIIKQTHWTHISKLYNIDFTRYNYSKEKSSTENAKQRNSLITPVAYKPL